MNTYENTPLTEEEAYQALRRSLSRKNGFNFLFARCSPVQSERIIEKINQDLPNKNSQILKLDSETDNIYNEIINMPDYKQINNLFVCGLEAALLTHEESLPSRDLTCGGNWTEIPRILGNLNLSRERFYETFSFTIVFLLSEFALRYFIKRAPDFFDWKSGFYEFPTDGQA